MEAKGVALISAAVLIMGGTIAGSYLLNDSSDSTSPRSVEQVNELPEVDQETAATVNSVAVDALIQLGTYSTVDLSILKPEGGFNNKTLSAISSTKFTNNVDSFRLYREGYLSKQSEDYIGEDSLTFRDDHRKLVNGFTSVFPESIVETADRVLVDGQPMTTFEVELKVDGAAFLLGFGSQEGWDGTVLAKTIPYSETATVRLFRTPENEIKVDSIRANQPLSQLLNPLTASKMDFSDGEEFTFKVAV